MMLCLARSVAEHMTAAGQQASFCKKKVGEPLSRMRPGRAAALAGGLAVLGVAAICAGVSRTATARSELMGEFDVYRPAISDLDLLSPSPLDYHTFDYNRPDFATRLSAPLPLSCFQPHLVFC